MDDITTRLRRWTHAAAAVPASDLMDEAAAEIERLREAVRRLADQDATLSVRGGNVTVTMDATLTDGERAALHWFAHYGLPEHRAAALRGLLGRTK
jgi:transcriptional regulator GlxA family with amidase domain